MRDKIKSYIESNLQYFGLEGVEIDEEDLDFAEEKIKQGKSIEDACDELLRGIREWLDNFQGLADFIR